MRHVAKLEIVLENCEVIALQPEHIGALSITGISRSIRRVACNSISELVECAAFMIEVLPSANSADNYASTWSGNETLPIRRLLEGCDITAVDIEYADGARDYIFVPWGGDSDCVNKYQSGYFSEDKTLNITISEPGVGFCETII